MRVLSTGRRIVFYIEDFQKMVLDFRNCNLHTAFWFALSEFAKGFPLQTSIGETERVIYVKYEGKFNTLLFAVAYRLFTSPDKKTQ